MQITSLSIKESIDEIIASLPAIQAELNAADAKLGDGDTGLMVSRMFQAFGAVEHEKQLSVSDYCLRLAQAGAKSTGSSFGTLIVASLMAIAKDLREQETVNDAAFSRIPGCARDAMISRGKTELGSKTAIDSLNYIAKALDDRSETEHPALIARQAAYEALDDFKTKECKIGRARMFSEKSKGLDDPGMLAIALALDAITKS